MALFGSHAFVKLKVLLHPKLKSHFQRAAILINAHFLYTKNFLLIKGDRRDAWGPFPHVWAVTTWEWRPRWRPCRCPRRYAAVVLAKVPRVHGGGCGDGGERGCSLLPCLPARRSSAPILPLLYVLHTDLLACFACISSFAAVLWYASNNLDTGEKRRRRWIRFWFQLLRCCCCFTEMEVERRAARMLWCWSKGTLTVFVQREREREADLQRFYVMDLRESDQGKGAG